MWHLFNNACAKKLAGASAIIEPGMTYADFVDASILEYGDSESWLQIRRMGIRNKARLSCKAYKCCLTAVLWFYAYDYLKIGWSLRYRMHACLSRRQPIDGPTTMIDTSLTLRRFARAFIANPGQPVIAIQCILFRC